LDVAGGETDLLLAILDDFSPTAIEERDGSVRAFFTSADSRDAARAAVSDRYRAEPIEVSDEDWARRSQENLQPITVGRITVVCSVTLQPPAASPQPLRIVIAPSMGFGTGHHATTRLCLEALQEIDVAGKRVLDVGTGSGVLAIAAARLGAADALGIDLDEDAIQSARENLTLNPEAAPVRFALVDLTSSPLPAADIVLANLTGALLVRAASTLRDAAASDGVVIVSGLLGDERDAVVAAFQPAKILWQQQEDEWAGVMMRKS
jgi:ribosomal protein L11 methyltransferase